MPSVEITTFFSSKFEVTVTSNVHPEGREFIVDSGVSLQVCRRSTTLTTANGTIDINEEATVFVKDFDLFVIVQFLEDTPAVLSF